MAPRAATTLALTLLVGAGASSGSTVPQHGEYTAGPAYGPLWRDASLNQSSSAPLMTFYMYRAVADEAYEPSNINMANLPGVLWYLHHEVVIQAPRKFRISKILRYKVQTRATNPLARLGMNFGARLAFDKGQATGPFVCGVDTQSGDGPKPLFSAGSFQNECIQKLKTYTHPFEWEKYGYYVGCNKLGNFPFPEFPVAYPNAAWYSLPAWCPSRPFYQEDAKCRMEDPGGLCQGVEPNGNGTCTWNYKLTGEISLDELVGIQDYWSFVNSNRREYDPFADRGNGFSWWDGIDNEERNAERVAAASKLFAAKYPDEPSDENLPAPPCDFKYNLFYQEWMMRQAPQGGGSCVRYQPGSQCFKNALWAKNDGMAAHPEWYQGLSAGSSIQAFQMMLYRQGKGGCDQPPCDA